MSKAKEELDALKEEVNSVNEKLKELSPEELKQVCGGIGEAKLRYFCFKYDAG